MALLKVSKHRFFRSGPSIQFQLALNEKNGTITSDDLAFPAAYASRRGL